VKEGTQSCVIRYALRLALSVLPLTLLAASCSVAPSDTASGLVYDADGPVVGAIVRVQATDNATLTDDEGRFTLAGLTEGGPVTVSAWKHGYYCAKVEGVVPAASDLALTLRRYQTNDNPAYEWMPPTGDDSCASCKPGVTEIWLENAHAGSATNTRFLTMYNGTDVEGNQSPLTRRGYSRDYGSFPLRPDPTQPYYGPGYKLDFPDTAGNCGACHTPGAGLDAPYGTDPNALSGADTFGVHCDFCHKVADVRLNSDSGMPFPNMPGVLSMDIRRPFPEDPHRYQLFFGTFDDDNVPEEDTYLPLLESSQFCAPCHFGVFWETVIYNSFGEWLESPYSDPETGQTCQDCHMPSPAILDGEPMTNVAPNAGGVERDPKTIHAHTQPGAMDEELLRNAATMSTTAQFEGDIVVVQVQITNDNTGHHVPTDFPGRHLVLLIKATDSDGRRLEHLDGSILPEWAGVGDPREGYYAGLPGKAFAKVLEELWTEISPSVAYWNPTRVVDDNRLAAFATDTSTYTFGAPEKGDVTVEVALLFRRAYVGVMDMKGWDVPDVLLEQDIVHVRR
jgi:mono/diheme cytochrome c family protein